MSILEILLLGIGLSMDAFAVSICKGLSAKRLQTRHYLIIGAWFGGFQALMPTIGFFLGSTFEQYITAFDHWVAFVLLSAIGANVDGKRTAMVYLVVEVVGVVTGVMLGEWNQGGFLPTTVMEDRNWGSGKITRLFVRAIGWEDVAPVVRQIPAVVRANQDAPYLVISTQDDQLDRIKTTFMWVEALLWLGIVASLMLGGFGIWYGTFAAVRARTREVGLKKAMGGSDKDILAQFLAEALCKSVAGGLLGILVGTLSVEVGAWSLGTSISYPLLAASSAGSILFSAIIGVAGGLYPAIQASRMDVVSALRFE